MSPHVYARLSGFGWTLLPLAPFRFERGPGRPGSLLATHFAPGGLRQASLTFAGGNPEVELAEETQTLEEILDLLPGPDADHWVIETTIFAVCWPESFTLGSTPKPPGFELIGPAGGMVFVQGPVHRSHLPPPTDMVGPGQVVRRQGQSDRWAWVELEYSHEGAAWRQVHRVVSLAGDHAFVVTSQALVGQTTLAEQAADEVAASLRPSGREEA
jgi:hypothetical protein